MIIDLDVYRNAWPKGLVTYAIGDEISSVSDKQFLQEIGLPRGREPEWVFTGVIRPFDSTKCTFGNHGVASLTIDTIGQVVEYSQDGSTYLNAGIKQLAFCLTLRKKAGHGRFPLRTELDVQRLADAYLTQDSTSLNPGSYWAAYIEEIREEVLEDL
jgi:hypothetical protein